MPKAIEIEQLMVATAATIEEIAKARKDLDRSAAVHFPAYRYVAERTFTDGNLLHVARTYRYSWLVALKRRFLLAVGLLDKAEAIQAATRD